MKFVITGRALKEKQVEKAVTMSAEKFCSASIMLETAGVELSHSHEVREAS
jgi:putative redox protein